MNTRQQRQHDIRRRASQPDPMYSYCRIIGCHQPATAGTDSGLNRRYCRKHEEHYERHGSHTKRSYRLADIQEHRKQATRWIKANAHLPAVIHAKAAIERHYQQAGPKIEAFRLRGLSPEERAWVAWARLREASIDPVRPLIAWLTIALTIQHDSQPETKREFQMVQAAKLIHRIASGSHKRWEHQKPNGITITQQMHRYPHSRGLVLRHIGKQLEQVAESVEQAFLANMTYSSSPTQDGTTKGA